MEKNTYPSYSVYYLEGAMLKIPHRTSRRVQIDTLDKARHVAVSVALQYKADVAIILFTAPYETKFVEVVHYK